MVSINRDWFNERFAFKGDVADLQSNPVRHYDPTLGRWLSEDPIGFNADSANVCSYVAPRQTPTGQKSGQNYYRHK